MDRYIGKVLNSRYQLEEIIGVGGMAVVYKASDLLIDRVVAVKILKDEFMQDEAFKRRFGNESKAIAMLSHTNIVDVYDVCLKNDIQYIVMEYIDGITLKQYIDQKGVLMWKEALYLTNQILAALEHAHERGIIHRDIKPHNIMLLKDGSIKVTDFGIARVARFESETMTDKAIGSVHYISPEQASGGVIDEKSDIYSVGVMLYEMVTAKLPFEAENPVSVAVMQVRNKAIRPTQYNSEIPLGLEQIILKAMEKNPDMRYQKAREMHIDLEKLKVDPSYTITMPAMAQDTSSTRIMDPVRDDNVQSDEGENEMRESKNKKNMVPAITGIVAAFLIVIIGFVVFGVVMNNDLFKSDKIKAPDLVGKQFDVAIEENPDVSIEKDSEEFSNVYSAGMIIEQNIKKDTKIKKGEIIKVTVSSGQSSIKVPNINELEIENAETILTSKGIKYKITREYSSSVKKDIVIKTDPKQEEEIDADTELEVFVSLGKNTTSITVPKLVGFTESDAYNKISSAGLKRGKITMEYSDKTSGTVISQSLSSGTSVSEGESIDLVISKGKKPNDDGNSGGGDTPAPVVVKHKIDMFLPAATTTGEETYDVKVFVNNKQVYREKVSNADSNKFTYELEVNKGDTIVVTINEKVHYNKTAS